MKPVKAILIDSRKREVRSVEITEHDQIAKLIDCRMFTVATYVNDQDCIMVDDEGLLTGPEHFFAVGESQPFAGNGLLMGVDMDTGDSVNPKSTVRFIEAMVSFMNPYEVHSWAKAHPNY